MKRKMGWAALMILSLLPGLAKADDTPMEAEAPIALTSPSAILCEASTGRVVFEKNADERRPVASVNKVMTILLTLEALDEGRVSVQDQVTVSPRAASMGGSQAFLDAGERYPLRAQDRDRRQRQRFGRRHRGASRRGGGSVCEADECARR